MTQSKPNQYQRPRMRLRNHQIRECYYTRQDIATKYIHSLLQSQCIPTEPIFLEPAAGSGAFVKPLLERDCTVKAIDTHPTSSGIDALDFLTQPVLHLIPTKDNLVVVGNPPFGRCASLAVKFFNHAATQAQLIAFIVPRSFRKMSIQDRLHMHFHLLLDEDVPPHAFLLDGNSHNVPCAWQIWQRQAIPRKKSVAPDISHLMEFTTRNQACTAIRRVGGRAGQVLKGLDHSPTSTYFVRILKHEILDILKSLDWTHERAKTAGVRSVSKKEIAYKLTEALTSKA